MISDTLWQKFIYDTPFNDDEMPLINSKKSTLDNQKNTFKVSGRSLYSLSEHAFEVICVLLRNEGFENIVIVNDYRFKSNSHIVSDCAKAHMMSFCYLLQKKGFNAIISDE